jgi:hypothetical protein
MLINRFFVLKVNSSAFLFYVKTVYGVILMDKTNDKKKNKKIAEYNYPYTQLFRG